MFDDGHALYEAVCDLGLEGVVAKRTTSRYGANVRGGWVKIKNPNYWRRESEIANLRHRSERGARRKNGRAPEMALSH